MENYYEKIVNIVRNYLGPAAPRFVDKQISFYLNRDDKFVRMAEVKDMAKWMSIGLILIMEDKKLVDECYDCIDKLVIC